MNIKKRNMVGESSSSYPHKVLALCLKSLLRQFWHFSTKHGFYQPRIRREISICIVIQQQKFSRKSEGRLNSNTKLMYQSIPSLTIPQGQFFHGQIPHPRAKKEFKTPTPGPKKRAKTSPPGHFSQLFTVKT